ncbi:MAG: hypothetical protein ACXWL2_04825 [Candidatus Chromulinivorax sp.]
MLYVTDLEGNITYIKEFDIFHSFLGEMRPNATSYAKKCGHILFPQAKTTTHIIGEIIPLEHGYFDIAVKHIADQTGIFLPKTQFPLGSTPIENAQLIIDLIKDVKKPMDISTNNIGTKIFDLIHYSGQEFTIYVQDGIANFHPVSINAPRSPRIK